MVDRGTARSASWVLAGALSAVAPASGCGAPVFTCAKDTQCRDGVAIGVCQDEGVCSFPDPACDSGQRFGAHGGGFAGQCVPVPDTSLGTSETTAGSAVETAVATSVDDSAGEFSTSAPATASATTTDGSGSTSVAGSDGSTGEMLDPSLLLWFRFDDALVDGLANDGVLGGVAVCEAEGCPTSSPGVIGSAATFDGLDDCARFDHVPALLAPQFTLAAWVRRDVAEPGFDSAFAKPVGTDPYNTWRMTVQGNGDLGEIVNVHVGLADDSGVDVNAPLPLGVWTHFAASWSGRALTTYLDGVPFETIASDLIEVDDQPVFVGCDDDHSPIGLVHFLHGALDDVRMYDRVLDDGEIAELFAQGG